MAKLNYLDLTVENIFKILNQNKFKYAVMNNHKLLPYVKNDIDILTNENSKKILRTLKKIKKEFNWDYLTFCNTWVTPYITQQSVETFNLYRNKGFKSLNIDFVRGLIFINGIILEKTSYILERRKIYNGKYFYISEEFELLMKISSLAKNIKQNNYKNKNYKYLKDILIKAKNKKIILFLNQNNLKEITSALYFLSNKKYFKFCEEIKKYKRKFFLINFIQNPLIGIINIIFRMKIKLSNIFVFFLNKNKIIKINSDKNKIPSIKKIISKFYKKKLFRNFCYLKSKYILNNIEKNTLDGGGVLVLFGSNLTDAINVNSKDKVSKIERSIFDYVVKMNKIIKC